MSGRRIALILVTSGAAVILLATFAIVGLLRHMQANFENQQRVAAAHKATEADRIAHWPKPRPEQFTLAPQVISNDCPDKIGCLVTFKLKVTYTGDPLDYDQTVLVTYNIYGGSSAPEADRFSMTGTDVDAADVHVLTSSRTAKLTLKAIRVVPR